MEELEIKRSKWIRGVSHVEKVYSYLLRSSDGKMCCLGFYLRSCGLSAEDIRGVSSPQQANGNTMNYPKDNPKIPKWLLGEKPTPGDYRNNSEAGKKLMDINDATSLGEIEREEEIKKRFAEHGVNITFID